MRKISELKTVLNKYIKEYNQLSKLKEQLVYNEYIYENILNILSKCISEDYTGVLQISAYLNSLFGNKYNDLQECIFVCEKMQKIDKTNNDEYKESKLKIITFAKEIKEEYSKNKKAKEEVLDKLLLMEDNVEVSRRIINNLKYSQLISKEDISTINALLRELGYSNTDVSFSIENLFLHNEKINDKKGNLNSEAKYKIIDLLSIGYETFDYPLVDNEILLNCLSDSVYDILANCSHDMLLDNYIDLLPIIGKDIKNSSELEFVIIGVLERIRDSLNEKIELIKDSDFIMDIELKNEIANECSNLIEQYNLYRNYLDEILVEKDIDITEEENKKDNNLFYLINKNGKCYLLSDVKDMPFEYISKITELISKFKDNTISNKKNKKLDFNSEFSELKDDQIRIIYKRIKDNNYLVYGAFIKKDDRKYRADFNNVIGRVGIISENSLDIESELEQFIGDNQRKWSR